MNGCPTCGEWQRAVALLMVQQGLSRVELDVRNVAAIENMTMTVLQDPATGHYVVTLDDDATLVRQ